MAGRRPVEEAFVAGRPAHRLLVVPQRRQALEKIVLHATGLRIPIVEVEGGTLTALAGFDGHQGVALVVGPRRYADPEEILARALERGEPAFILVLDSLEDPQNVGTLLRSAEAAATHGVIFPTKRQAPLTPSAVKASAGAVEHLLLAPVDDLPASLADLHARGLRIVGADADATLTVRDADLRGPLALVVGSEGQGLGPAIRRRCDLLVRIPMRGAVGSLNASVAGSILLYEASTQRGDTRSAGPAPAATPSAAEPAVPPPAGDADHGDVDDGAGRASSEPTADEPPSPASRRSALKRSTTKRPRSARAEADVPAEPSQPPEPSAPSGAPTRTKRRKAAGPSDEAATDPTGPPDSSAVSAEPSADDEAILAAVELRAPAAVDVTEPDELLPGGPAPVAGDGSAMPGAEATGTTVDEPVVRSHLKAGSKAGTKPAKRGKKSDTPVAKGHKGKAKSKGTAAERG